jgi:glycosyltransferase involved in cell wall biosynthesis
MEKAKKYLMNGFKFQYDVLQRELSSQFNFTFIFPKSRKMDFIQNYLLYRKWQKQGKIKDFDIIHINAWENMLNYERVPGQISIAESHGFHLGANFKRFLIDEASFWKRSASYVMEFFLSKKMKRQINKFDLYYCSTPDMVQPLREQVRSDVQWLPNPIDTNFFTPNGPKIKLSGDPAIFFPTRLHKDKRPDIGIKIFQDYILKEFPKATLHFIQQPFNGEYSYWKKRLGENSTYRWDLKFMPREELIKYYRGSDMVIGGFSIGACGLMELEAMACGVPVMVNDLYELKTPIEKLGPLMVRILKDKKFRSKWVKEKRKYVISVHGHKAVAEEHLNNLKRLGI